MVERMKAQWKLTRKDGNRKGTHDLIVEKLFQKRFDVSCSLFLRLFSKKTPIVPFFPTSHMK